MSPRTKPLGEAQLRLASENDLLTAAAEGDRGAIEHLTERFTPMVRRVAGRLYSPGGTEELEDLIQVGQIGLLEAISRFRPERGSFGAYASVTIAGTIKRHFRDRSWKVRIPRSLHDAAQKVGSANVALEARLGRPPTEVEIAESTGIDLPLVLEARALLTAAHPLSMQSSGGTDLPGLGETLGRVDEGLEKAEARGTIHRLSADLEPRDRHVLALRFGLERTQVEIAEEVGVSQMQVSRLLKRALATMRLRAAADDGPAGEARKVAA